MIADEQHKLEIQRFRIAAEESQRDVIHRDRELHKDLVQLHRQHQTELETQVRECVLLSLSRKRVSEHILFVGNVFSE